MTSIPVQIELTPSEELRDLVDDLTEALSDRKSVNINNTYSLLKPVTEWCGFKVGDEVVFITGIYPTGLRAVVTKPPTGVAVLDGNVPVLRNATNSFDQFPAAATILASKLECYHKPVAREFYLEKPSGDTSEWNKRVLDAAVENKLTVRFTYVKPAQRFEPSWKAERRTRTVRPLHTESIGPLDEYSIVQAVDIELPEESERVRNFRLDRIEGYVSVVS